jgi:GxxExxY protein
MENQYLHSELSGKIIKAFYNVYNTLGFGFYEKIYENAMIIELNKMNLIAENQEKIIVFYEAKNVGEYYADIVVEHKIIVELKTVDTLNEDHDAQILNYLKATNIEIGLLLNFGIKPQVKRRILTNDLKPSLPR